jgi:hypothetical protein
MFTFSDGLLMATTLPFATERAGSIRQLFARRQAREWLLDVLERAECGGDQAGRALVRALSRALAEGVDGEVGAACSPGPARVGELTGVS